MNIIEILRKEAVENCFNTKSFSDAWEDWRPHIKSHLHINAEGQDLLNLGDVLSDVFLSTRGDKMAVLNLQEVNSKASRSGKAWECLITWYLNLCSVGSRVVAFNKTSAVPAPLKNAIKVSHGSTATNSESDIILVVFPEVPHFTDPLLNVPLFDVRQKPYAKDKDGRVRTFHRKGEVDQKILYQYINAVVAEHISKMEMGVLQCKTNWNENSQIPMLWDIIYRLDQNIDRDIPNLKVGSNGFAKRQLKRFSYSFMTVPTNDYKSYSATGLAVKRVGILSGGNYWGYPSKQGVAQSLKEIFTYNFMAGFDGSVSGSINKALRSHIKYFEHFRLF